MDVYLSFTARLKNRRLIHTAVQKNWTIILLNINYSVCVFGGKEFVMFILLT